MSLYFAYKPNQDTEQTVSASVSDRGLSLLRAKPCDINVVTFVASVQPAYSSYISNLPYFMLATAQQSDKLIGTGCAPLQRVDIELPWTMPPLIYDYTMKLKEPYIETLKVHSTAVTDARSKNPTFVMQEPTRDDIKALSYADVKPQANTRHVIGTVNLDAMRVVLTLKTLTSVLLLTHAYPAFRTVDDLNPVEERAIIDSPIKKRKVDDTRYLACATDPTTHTTDLTVEEMTALETNPNAVPTIKLHTAKHTPITGPNWGSMEHLPNAEGLFFPYVRDLSVSDSMTVPNFVTHYLAKCLGPDLSTVVQSLQKLGSAWGLIKDTELGHEVSHLYKCIDIAFRCQAAVYPIYTNSVYEGAVIWGSGLYIGINGLVYKPISFDKLQVLVQDKSMHSNALREIKNLAGGMSEEAIEKCKTIRELSIVVQGLPLDTLQKEKVVVYAQQLCFPNKYWSSQQRYINLMLDMFRNWSDNTGIPSDVPMHPSMLFSVRREEVILSAFGHQAPSFLIPNGRNVVLTKGSAPPLHLYMRTIGLKQAVSDMEYVVENGIITNNNTNLSAKHKDSAFNGSIKKEVWSKLCDLIIMDDQKPAAAAVVNDTGDGNGAFDFEW